MIVISDTTPIISLLKAGHLELLHQLHEQVFVPQAVWRELTENPSYVEEKRIIETTKFLSAVPVKSLLQKLLRLFRLLLPLPLLRCTFEIVQRFGFHRLTKSYSFIASILNKTVYFSQLRIIQPTAYYSNIIHWLRMLNF